MTFKNGKSFAEGFSEQFAYYMSQVASQQTSFWQQAGVALLTKEQQQQFLEGCHSRFQEYLQGVQLYQQSSGQREMSDPPVIWALGSAKVLDYSQTKDPNAPILFVVPSLINRAYILDLTEDLSFLRQLAQEGIRPFLLDWGELSEAERDFSLEDYIKRYLFAAYDHVKSHTQQPVSMLGYCMGGNLTLATAQLRPDVEKLILLATPWDFHAGHEWLTPWIHASSGYLGQVIDQSAELPIEQIQSMFAMLNPLSVIRKFRKLPKFSEDLKKIQDFAIVEDWLNDCTPLAAKVAKECLFGWYLDNKTLQKQWTITEQVIDPSKLTQPILVILPQADKIVPPSSAEALTQFLLSPQILRPETGHLGAIIGRQAKEQIIPKLIEFIRQ